MLQARLENHRVEAEVIILLPQDPKASNIITAKTKVGAIRPLLFFSYNKQHTMTREESHDWYYAKGQKDYSKYDPPGPDVFISLAFGKDKSEIAAKEAYDEGWEHAKSQDNG